MAIDPREVRARLDDVVAAMKANGGWDVARPADEAFANIGAFGLNTMAFSQWLRWVFAPTIEERLAAGGPWPGTSAVAVQAVREGDTDPRIAALVPALRAFDELFDAPAERARAMYERSREAFARGDHAAAYTDVLRALALDPACDNAENFAGWILWNKPGRTVDELDAAIAHFRRAPAGVASANLADALVAAGRADEAIASAAALPGQAEARSWLGWYFLQGEPPRDLVRATTELREAVRLRAAWGVPWQHLARALDLAGDAAEACRAYGEAIACGDAVDDGFARDRRVQLELALRSRGQAPPDAPAPARADSCAARIVLAAAALPELGAGQTFFLRPTARVPVGAMPFAGVATVASGRAMYHLIVRDDGGARVAFVQTRDGDAPITLRWTTAADPERAAAWLGDWLAADGANVYALTPLDTALFVFDLLAAHAPRRWRLAVGGGRPAAFAIEDVDANVAIEVRAAEGGSVEVDLGGGERVHATSPAQLVPHAAAIVAAVQRGVAHAVPRPPNAPQECLAVPGRLFADALATALGGSVLALPVEAGRAPAHAVVVAGRPLALVLDRGVLTVWLAGVRSWHVGIGDDASSHLDEIVAAARGRAAATDDAPTLLAVAVRAAQLLGAALGETWTFAIPGTPEPHELWLRGSEPAADAVGVFADTIHIDGVRTLHVHRLAELEAHADDLVAGVRAQRARFARAQTVAARMERLAGELVVELGQRLGINYCVSRRPRPPSLVATVTEAGNGHAVAVELTNDLDRDGDDIIVHAGARGEAGWDGHLTDVSAAIDHIAAAVARRRTILTRDTLREGRHYRVVADFAPLVRGMVVRFDRFDDIDNHYGKLEFVDDATGTHLAIEGDYSTPDHGPLADAYRYLEEL